MMNRLVSDELSLREQQMKHMMEMNPKAAMEARNLVLDFAKAKVLCPIIYSKVAPEELKESMKRTIARMERMDVLECIRFIKNLVVSEEPCPNDVANRLCLFTGIKAVVIPLQV